MTAKRTRASGHRAAKEEMRQNMYVVEGNTARELVSPEVPVPVREERQERERRRSGTLRERALQLSPTFMMLLAFTAVLMLATCVYYMQEQVSIYARISNIEDMEGTLEELKDANEAAKSRIEAASDINRIYKIATEKLGMFYPENSQIIYYNRTESEYVQQYEEIPR